STAPPNPIKSANAGAGCLMLFGLPFFLAGLLSLWAGYSEWSSGDPQENWWVALVVGSVFTLVGGGIMAGGYFGRGKMLSAAQAEQRHPEQPWMWRPDWAQGRVDSDAKGVMWFAWIFALFWNGISAIPLIVGWEELSDEPWTLALVALFPLIGVFLLVWAVRATLRYRKFGVSRFELSTLPGVIGGRLAGRIETRLPEPPAAGVRLSLDSIRMVRSGKSTREKLLWKDEQVIPAGRLSRGWQGVSIPVEFRIPADAEESSSGSRRCFWRLSATAEVAGVDFQANFEAPVYRTAESAREAERTAENEAAGDAGWTFASEREPAFDPSKASFVQRISPMGGVEYHFPPGSQRRGGVGMAVFLLIWLGALAAMLHFEAPWLFVAFWGVFAVLIALATLDALFGSATIRLESDRIEVQQRILGFGRARSIRFDEIASVRTEAGTTQSQTATQASRIWWHVRAERKAGGEFRIGQNLVNKQEAEWLAAQIRRKI
ncbi:MAG: hypothetical protein KDC27_18415, partial [Acidobacteria bacterium]|nr:hypothetical protein [Acidobacteriota bacterium]